VIRSHHFAAILKPTAAIANSTTADLVQLLKNAVQAVGLVSVSEATATFTPHGVSAVLILAESHVALHIWPERRRATVDIHICDYQQDNGPKAEKLAALLAEAITGSHDRTRWSQVTIVG